MQSVSGLLDVPPDARACYVLAHGAGAGMAHPFMQSVAQGLAQRGIGVLRYQFPFMENGSKRPDSPALAHATVRAAVGEASRRFAALPLMAGGKSFGGRMTSQAQAASALPGVRALVFLGFPLHPAGRPSKERADHLARVDCPMLFIQGANDRLADPDLLQSVVQALGPRATLESLPGADHSFHVPARSGTNDDAIRSHMLDALVSWFNRLAPG